MGADTKLSQAIFLREYLAHGNAIQAYKQAGYEGNPEAGASQVLRKPFVQEGMRLAAERIQATALAEVEAHTVDRLQTRPGLSEWLVSVVRGDEVCTYVTEEGEKIAVPAHMKERIAAAKLLAAVQGMLVQKVEHEVKGDVFVFHTLDNGRAQRVPGSVKVIGGEDRQNDERIKGALIGEIEPEDRHA